MALNDKKVKSIQDYAKYWKRFLDDNEEGSIVQLKMRDGALSCASLQELKEMNDIGHAKNI